MLEKQSKSQELNKSKLQELISKEVIPFYNKELLKNNEFVYLDYTEDKQYTLRAKKDIPKNTKLMDEYPIIFIPDELKYDQDPFVQIVFDIELLIKQAKQYQFEDHLYFFNFAARFLSLIGIADDIYQSLLTLSDGNLSKKIILCEKSQKTLKNLNLTIWDSMKEQFKNQISESDLFKIICVCWSNVFWTLEPEGIALYLSVSRINHSCKPNAFDNIKKKQQNVYSCRDIKQNEEISITYIINNNILFEERQPKLQDFNFICKCELCCDKDNKSIRIARCEKCKNGKMIMNDFNMFVCQQCGRQENQEFTLRFEISEKQFLDEGFQNWTQTSILHPAHYGVINYWIYNGINTLLQNKDFDLIDQFIEIFSDLKGEYSHFVNLIYQQIINQIEKSDELKEKSEFYNQKIQEIKNFVQLK